VNFFSHHCRRCLSFRGH